jgi:hypothetical protein
VCGICGSNWFFGNGRAFFYIGAELLKGLKMKLIILVTLNSIALNAAACPDLTGYYREERANKITLITHVSQVSCDKITLGYITLKDGQVIQKIDPAVSYYNVKNCGSNCHLRFEEFENALRLRNGGSILIPAGGLIEKHRCNYDNVNYSLTTDGDLKLSYLIVSSGAEDPCSKVGDFSEVAKRIPAP